jgi:intein/homing endonuclease
MIRNLGETLNNLKPKLRAYLQKSGTQFKGRLFQCPNRKIHKNQDVKPACNFVDPEETRFFCYVCLPGPELVRTTRGLIPIKDVKLGDYTYNILGNPTKIVKIAVHNPEYKILKVTTGLNLGLKLTENHAVPIITRNEATNMPYFGKQLGRPLGLKFYGRALDRKRISKYNESLHINKVPAGELIIGDYVLYPSTRKTILLSSIDTTEIIRKYSKGPKLSRINNIELSDDILWLFGLYVAEGNTYRGGIRFTLNRNEVVYQQKIMSIIKAYFMKPCTEQIRGNAWTCTCSSTDLEVIFRDLFGELAENKRYPYYFNYLEKRLRQAFMNGVMGGDGSKSGRTLRLTSPTLIKQLFDLAVSLKKIPYYSEQEQYTDKHNIVHLRTYSLYFRDRASCTGYYEMIDGVEYLLHPITKMEIQTTEKVYDITVEDSTHSFLTEGFAVYNCGSTGDIINAVNLLENKPITGTGFHDTVEYLCKLLKVPFQIAEDTPESQFLQEVNHFLSALVKKGHENLLGLIEKEPNHEAVKFLLSKGWIQSVDDYNLGIIAQVQQNKSQKVIDICNFLNLDLNDLLKGIIIPIEFHQKLIGFQIRSLVPDDTVKYRTYLTTNKGLFNLDKLDPTLPVYVVEGASSVLVFNTFGITNVVSTLGNGFNKDHYESLLTREVKDLIVIYDNDEGGNIGRGRVSTVCVNHSEINVSFKLLSEHKDPADYLLDGKKIEDLSTLTLWDYLVYMKNKDLLLRYVAAQNDLIQKEKLVNELTKILDVSKLVLVEEIQKFEDVLSNSPTISSLKEKESLIETINVFEKWAWTRGALLGIKSFECFDKNFDGLQEGLVLVGGPPNVGKCLSGETLIQTTLGLVPIQSLFKDSNKIVDTFTNPEQGLSVPGPLSLEPVTKLYYSKSKCYKVVLNNGKEIIGTPEHPLLTSSGVFKQLQNLTLKDQLITSNGANIWGTKITLNKFVPDQQVLAAAKIIPTRYPIELTEDLAFLLGLYIGDGACNAPDFSITQKTPYDTTISKLIKKLFGVTPHAYQLELSAGRLIRAYFKDILGAPHVTGGHKEVPPCILTSPKEIVAAFIMGYFMADGYINKTRIEISLTTKSCKMSQQLATILDNFGVRNYIKIVHNCATNTKLKIKRDYYTVTIRSTYEDAVRFRNEICNKRRGRTGKFRRLSHLTGKFNRAQQPLRTNKGIRFEPIGIKHIELLQGEREVYDISIPTTHQFIANGIVSHNSALLTSMACLIMNKNPEAYVVYLTIDDSALVTTARFLANLSGIPINIVSNPKYKIMENKYYTDEERKKLIVAREKALDYMRKNVSVFNMKDSSAGYTVEYVNTLLKSLDPLLKDKKLVLFIDNLHKLKSEKDYRTDKTLVDNVCSNLKLISGRYRCPVICTVEHTKAAIYAGETGGTAIKETSALQYDANLILTVILKQVVGTFKLVDVIVGKNKMSTFIGSLPFKLYPDLSKMEESEGSVAIFGGTGAAEEKKEDVKETGQNTEGSNV